VRKRHPTFTGIAVLDDRVGALEVYLGDFRSVMAGNLTTVRRVFQ
jgi:hypothetical protein